MGNVWGFRMGVSNGVLNVLYCMVCGSCMAICRRVYMVFQMGLNGGFCVGELYGGYVGGCCVAEVNGDYVRGFSVRFVSWDLV